MKTSSLLMLSVLFLQGCTTQHTESETSKVESTTGLFQYMADAPLITLCTTGQRYPVAMEGAYIELEHAYLKSGVAPGSKAWVQVRGRVGERPAMEGEGQRAFFIVDQFDSIEPERQCASQESIQWEGREWQLVEMPGTDLTIPKDKPPTVYFNLKDQRVAGFGGCNRFFGAYQRSGNALTIGPLGSTRMSCGDLDKLEHTFLQQLEKVQRWQVSQHQLSLSNDNQVILIFKNP
jgi:copper homeostasis protein (lipoprotein)